MRSHGLLTRDQAPVADATWYAVETWTNGQTEMIYHACAVGRVTPAGYVSVDVPTYADHTVQMTLPDQAVVGVTEMER